MSADGDTHMISTLDQHPRIYSVHYGPCCPLTVHLLPPKDHTLHCSPQGQGQAGGKEIPVSFFMYGCLFPQIVIN